MKRIVIAVTLSLVAALAGCSKGNIHSTDPNQLIGAGSTFVNPLMIRWAREYEKDSGVQVRYESVGSTGGINRLIAQDADFACTDGLFTDKQRADALKAGGEIRYIPLVMAAVVPAYNLPEAKEPLRFSGPVLADIFLGRIRKWNDPALRDLNPGVGLPDQDITVVRRDDGSGTTSVWTDYLSKVSPAWKEKIGVSQHTDSWGIGVRQTGNEGVARHVRQTQGSLGYVDLAHAYQFNVNLGLVRNRAGEFIKPSLDAVTAAAAGALAEIPDDFRFSLTDPPGKGAYPICGTTWAVIYVKQPSARREKLAAFLRWMTHEGQEFAAEGFYARLPEALVQRVGPRVDEIQAGK